MTGPERISLELSNACRKACWFCYSGSNPDGASRWTVDDVVGFVRDCAAHGVRAVSFGGGEPLEHDGLVPILTALRGVLFRSLTTSGLGLEAALDDLVRAAPDKVHVSVHFPERPAEVERVARQVQALAARGIRSGVNLLVRRSELAAARRASLRLHHGGIGPERIVYLPMRGHAGETPTPAEIAEVAGTPRFQSMTCLTGCGPSPRFCAIGWDRTVAWCSYTTARAPLASLDHAALRGALSDLDLVFCGGTDDRLVRLSRRALDGHDVVRDRS